MQSLLLIYGSEKDRAAMLQDEMGKMDGEYFAFTEAVKKEGSYIGGNPLRPTTTATTVRVRA